MNGSDGFRLFPEQASTLAERVDALYMFLLVVSGFFTVLIFTLVIGFAVKYRRRSETETPRQLPTHLGLEMLWITVPLGLTMVMFVWGARVYVTWAQPPPGALQLFVVGQQWMWKFQHPNGRREINELHVPLGQPVKLLMTSQDVIHSLFIPAFRVKMDAVPGRYTTTWFEATKTGAFHLFCAEYCGTQHSGMIGRIVVMQPAEYQRWLAGAAGPGQSMANAGAQHFRRLGCATCHLAEATARGPALEGIFGNQVRLRDGRTILADESYLRESIVRPNAKIVAGYEPIMPTYEGMLNEEQMLQLIAYLKSLAPPAYGDMDHDGTQR